MQKAKKEGDETIEAEVSSLPPSAYPPFTFSLQLKGNKDKVA
jgi:hypothetical protein